MRFLQELTLADFAWFEQFCENSFPQKLLITNKMIKVDNLLNVKVEKCVE